MLRQAGECGLSFEMSARSRFAECEADAVANDGLVSSVNLHCAEQCLRQSRRTFIRN